MEPRGEPYRPHVPQSPYDPGALTSGPANHLVKVKPNARNIAGQLGAAVICLGVGLAAVITAATKPDVDGRWFALIAGGLFTLVGLVLMVMLKRVLHTRRYTFTRLTLAGENYSYGTFTLEWSAVESITIRAHRRRSFWRAMLYRNRRNRTTAFLRLTLRPGVELTGPITSLTARGVVTIPFWNRPDLIDALAYGCQTYAAEQFRGVNLI